MPKEQKTFQIAASLEGFTLHKDGGAALRFVTNEMSAEDIVVIKAFYNTFGFLLFKENEFMPDEVPATDAAAGGKSPSQRLRNTIFLLYAMKHPVKGPGVPSFDSFYNTQMEAVITHYKSKLPQ